MSHLAGPTTASAIAGSRMCCLVLPRLRPNLWGLPALLKQCRWWSGNRVRWTARASIFKSDEILAEPQSWKCANSGPPARITQQRTAFQRHNAYAPYGNGRSESERRSAKQLPRVPKQRSVARHDATAANDTATLCARCCSWHCGLYAPQSHTHDQTTVLQCVRCGYLPEWPIRSSMGKHAFGRSAIALLLDKLRLTGRVATRRYKHGGRENNGKGYCRRSTAVHTLHHLVCSLFGFSLASCGSSPNGVMVADFAMGYVGRRIIVAHFSPILRAHPPSLCHGVWHVFDMSCTSREVGKEMHAKSRGDHAGRPLGLDSETWGLRYDGTVHKYDVSAACAFPKQRFSQ
jgi:hypothetical protein